MAMLRRMLNVFQRYIVPLIAPPTPPQLAQDKASVDESFDRAFTLLDQLNSDTTALKASEEARTQRLDAALADVESVLASLKEAARRQDNDNRQVGDEMKGLRALIPKALEAQKESSDARLKELGTELKSLKTLVANRMGAGIAGPRPGVGGEAVGAKGGSGAGSLHTTTQQSPASAGPNGTAGTNGTNVGLSSDGQVGSVSSPGREHTSSPYGRLTGGRAAIPAWQMAAAKKNSELEETKDTSESGTVTEVDAAS